jgi:hypothetical protein
MSSTATQPDNGYPLRKLHSSSGIIHGTQKGLYIP